MSRPAQVEQQIARVNELQAELLEGNKPQTPDPEANTDIVVEETPPEPAPEPNIAEPPVHTVSKADYDKLDQRYRTLQGMYQADNVRSRNEIASLQDAVHSLETRLAQAAVSTPPVPTRYVTENDEEVYGDTLDMVRRAAREEAEQTAAKREEVYLERIAQLEKLVGNIQNTVVPAVENITRSQEEKVVDDFWTDVNSQVPDWEKHNTKPEFLAWLAEEDPVTGATRMQFLRQARATFNAPRVIRIFKEWERQAAGGQTPAPHTAQNLERMVAPGTSKTGGSSATPAKKIWTNEDVSAFYADVNRGRYRGREAEQEKMANDIFAAQAEGRFKYK